MQFSITWQLRIGPSDDKNCFGSNNRIIIHSFFWGQKVNHTSKKSEHEIEHGQYLSATDTEMTWGWGTSAGRKRAERRAHLILKNAHIMPNQKVLEIGCGTGMFTEKFMESGASITAVDISPDLLELAQTRGLPEEQVRFIEGRFEDCQLGGPFDAIIGSSVLHHLNIMQALHKILTLLKPSGYFCFAEPNMLNPIVYCERKFRKYFPHVSADETAIIRWQFAHQLLEAGFTEIDLIPFDWLHPATPTLLIPLVSLLGATAEHVPLVREFSGSILIRSRKPSI
jgi:2-polyprenyl-3-methyl-5-hydroxy-6-metoxy-1,4-benzoquinol methylase